MNGQPEAMVNFSMVAVSLRATCPTCGETTYLNLYANVEVYDNTKCWKCPTTFFVTNPLATKTGIEIQGRRLNGTKIPEELVKEILLSVWHDTPATIAGEIVDEADAMELDFQV